MYLKNPDGRVFETDFPQYHKDCERLTKTEGLRLLQLQCAAELRPLFRPSKTVYAIIRKVSASGMTRYIDFYAYRKGRLEPLTYRMSVCLGWRLHDKGLVVGGCGMDMVFHTVDTLCRTIGLKKLPQYTIL